MSFIPMGGYKLLRLCCCKSRKRRLLLGNGFEAVAQQFKVSREDQDEFAYHSYESLESTSRGKDKQIVPITVDQTFVNEQGKKETKSYIVNKDEGPRAGTSKEALV
jgi:acetyl-CoA acyltransferase